jgi:hypothetical protein
MEKKLQQRRHAIDSTKHLIDTVSKIAEEESPLGTVTQVNAGDQVGMKVSNNMPKAVAEAIALPEEKRAAWERYKTRRLGMPGKKAESIMDDKKPESIMEGGEDE